MEKKNYPLHIKLVLIGDSSTGKTCLFSTFKDGTFKSHCKSTIAIDFGIKTVELDGKNISLQVWDTAGQERYDSLSTPFYSGARGIMAIYDITKPETLKNISEKWLKKTEQYGDDDVVKMIVGNKCDLEDQRQVPTADGEAEAKQLGVRFLEVSAKDRVNVDKAFLDLAQAALEEMSKRGRKEWGVSVSIEETGGSKKCCC